ncbi:Hypothetical protein CRIB_755 [Romboutsia ilealis]|uniref:Uncharacterized protein n=1 Tax=Romboutsia ilealis TaxID=1115758 RepID=A0A1V1I061_9FIRM|nr:hypothetical protein [Romboutsia ilealis]CED93507.1 Hypothetical protein CRIB_755 [Romboutsia ilealis]
MKVIIAIVISTLLTTGEIYSSFNESIKESNLAIFNKEYEKVDEMFNLELRENNLIKEYNVRTEQQPVTISESKAILLVKDMLKTYGYVPRVIEVDHREGNNYVVHAYEIIQDDEKTWHTATIGWYYVDMYTGKIESIF